MSDWRVKGDHRPLLNGGDPRYDFKRSRLGGDTGDTPCTFWAFPIAACRHLLVNRAQSGHAEAHPDPGRSAQVNFAASPVTTQATGASSEGLEGEWRARRACAGGREGGRAVN